MSNADSRVSVRPATAPDAADIAAIQVASLRSVARAVGGASVGIPYLEVQRAWNDTLSRTPPPGCSTMVALHGSRVVGFVVAQPAPSHHIDHAKAPDIPDGLELAALDVDERFRRSGHASRMLAAIVDTAREAGLSARSLQVWISPNDEARVRFFQSAGFAPAGLLRRLDVAGTPMTQHLWWAGLDSAGSGGGGRPNAQADSAGARGPEGCGHPAESTN